MNQNSNSHGAKTDRSGRSANHAPSLRLSRSEKLLIADALNGCNILLQCEPNWLAMMRGMPGNVLEDGTKVVSGLYAEIADSIQINGLDTKWEVDGKSLLQKIHALSPDQRESLCRQIAYIWARNDDNFERDLEAFNP